MRNPIPILLFVLFGYTTSTAQTIINQYASVLSYTPCSNQMIVDTATGFNVGNDVLVIEMKGGTIDSSNTSSFGQILNWNNAGHYEVNKIASVNGNTITLQYVLTKNYDIPNGIVQIVSIPHYASYAVNNLLTCGSWTGKKGGIFAVIVDNDLTLNNNIDIHGTGFTAGVTDTPSSNIVYILHQMDYCYPINQYQGSHKGEGIGTVSYNKIYCRGPLYNGGGGGNSTNCGGGGGGNGGIGGIGGNEWYGANPSGSYGGLGGQSFSYSAALDELFIGGGGGAGHINDGTIAKGGNGGGLVLIIANTINGNNYSIIADGAQGQDCFNTSSCIDGVGGGGAGGTIVINAQNISQLNVSAKGGNGASIDNNLGPHGTGGGGGGGALFINNTSLPVGVNVSLTGGIAGIFTGPNGGPTNWGAAPGNDGQTILGFVPFIDTNLFSPLNITIGITDLMLNCGKILFTDTGTTSQQTDWNFGDGTSGNGNPVIHAYLQNGTYHITLLVSDTIGTCIDTLSGSIDVNINDTLINFTINDSIYDCKNVLLTAINNSGSIIAQNSWIFGDGAFSNMNPVTHSYVQSGTYNISFIATDIHGCVDTFNKTINIPLTPSPIINVNVLPCSGQFVFIGLDSNGLNGVSYLWNFGDNNRSTSDTVTYLYSDTGIYVITLTETDAYGCKDSTKVTEDVHGIQNLILNITGDSSICYGQYDQLNASGAVSYSWLPSDYITNSDIANPWVHPIVPTTYVVTGTGSNGCIGKDSIFIDVRPLPVLSVSVSGSVTCSDTAVQLSASGAATYTWAPAAYVVNDDVHSQNPYVSPLGNTEFTVTGTDATGCSNIDSILVVSDKSASLFMPSAFTPNNDGLNDVIYPKVFCDLILDQFSIYNRWGQRVFTTSVEGAGWDGRFNGVPQPIGTFDYYVKGHKRSTSKSVFYKGNFTLVR